MKSFLQEFKTNSSIVNQTPLQVVEPQNPTSKTLLKPGLYYPCTSKTNGILFQSNSSPLFMTVERSPSRCLSFCFQVSENQKKRVKIKTQKNQSTLDLWFLHPKITGFLETPWFFLVFSSPPWKSKIWFPLLTNHWFSTEPEIFTWFLETHWNYQA